jgi:hypothetical protein
MATRTPPPDLVALRAAITTFLDERRDWPPERRRQAKREISELKELLKQAAAKLGVNLTDDDDSDPGDPRAN